MPSDAKRVQAVFLAAVATSSAAERVAVLDCECGGDAELRQRVEAMLHAYDEPDSLANRPSVGQAGTGETPPARYQIIDELARGEMGTIFRARDAELNREVALKQMQEHIAHSPELRQRFLVEAEVTGRLEHPGIVPVYGLGVDGQGRLFYAMRFIRGESLHEAIRRFHEADMAGRDPGERSLAWRGLLTSFVAVCAAVAYAHARGVVHRDLEPGNIMLGQYGEVQVMDWGLAKLLASEERQSPEESPPSPGTDVPGSPAQTQAQQVLGTPAYMAPEQASGEDHGVDVRTDVFGLGAILCEVLTGQPPFSGPPSEALGQARRAELTGALERLDRCGADGELITLAKRCLAPQPEDRPRSAREVAQPLSAYLEQASARVWAVEHRKRRRLTLALAALVLLTMLLGAGGSWLLQRARRQAATASAVHEALEQAALLRGRAAAVGDLSRWDEALSAVQRAEALLAQRDPDQALQARVTAVRDEIQRGRDAAAGQKPRKK
jgi:serine/threonine-protein kinase